MKRVLLVVALLLVAGCVASTSLDVSSLIIDLVHRATAAYETAPVAVASLATALLTLWIVAFLPTTLPELAIGFVFGLQAGYAVDLFAKYLGSAISFGLGRTVLRSSVQNIVWGGADRQAELSERGHVAALFAAVENEVSTRPFLVSFLIRAAYLPMPMKNYGQAVLGIPPLAFFATMVPVEILDTYLFVAVGASANDLATLLRGDATTATKQDAADAWLHLGLLAVAICATAILVAALGQVAMASMEARRKQAAERATASSWSCVQQERSLLDHRIGEEEANIGASSLLL